MNKKKVSDRQHSFRAKSENSYRAGNPTRVSGVAKGIRNGEYDPLRMALKDRKLMN